MERNRDKSLGVSVYLGQRRGNASTSDFSPGLRHDTVRAAYDIARFTAEGRSAGLPDAEDLALDAAARRHLDLFTTPGPLMPPSRRRDWLLRCEAAALRPTSASPTARAPASRRSNRTLDGQQPRLSAGLCQFAAFAVGGANRWPRQSGMERDAWYSSMRDAAD